MQPSMSAVVRSAAQDWTTRQIERAQKHGPFTATLEIHVNLRRLSIDHTSYYLEDYGYTNLTPEGGRIMSICQFMRMVASCYMKDTLNEAKIPYELEWVFDRVGEDYSATATVKLG